ncbi:MAG: hypothetical protein ACRCZ2_06720 [Fusobacteriaceae bacterium]
MDKGKIIRISLLRLGKNNAYNDNKSDEYIVANELLDHVIETLAKDTAYIFNSTSTILTKFTPETNELGETRFNKPIDYLNLIRADKVVREEGEYIYSKDNDVIMQYNRKVDIANIQDYMADIIIYHLCFELCLAFNSWIDRLQIFESKIKEERTKLISNQYNNFNYGG